MTNSTVTARNRHRFDVRVWFNDGTKITVCNIKDDRSDWNRDNAKRTAEATATSQRYHNRNGVKAVAIVRSFQTPNSRP